jgi:hypothetical protein
MNFIGYINEVVRNEDGEIAYVQLAMVFDEEASNGK